MGLETRILLLGGTLVDGTGGPPRPGDLLIEGDRIHDLGHFDHPTEAIRIDCSGLVIAPGFIDGHSHSDLQVLEPHMEKVRQGVTTEVVGNCGFSPYPARGENEDLHDFANGIFCGQGKWGWATAADYAAEARTAPLVNVISLVGHGSLRIWQVGNRHGTLSTQDLRAMNEQLAEALDSGAAGLSTGLMYAPGSSAPFAELEHLCREVASHGKIHATHMRSYSDHLVDAVKEQIELAQRTGCRLQISHFQAVGSRNWHLQQVALEEIEKASQQGLDIAFDCYPYLRGSTVLSQILPQWALEGGTEGLLAQLRTPDLRRRIASETTKDLAQGWENIFVSAVASAENQSLVGRNFEQVGELLNKPPVEAAIDLLIAEKGRVNILEVNQSVENLRQALTHPFSNIISDGFYVKGKPHPRLYGTFPLFLGEICRTRGWLTLPEAIRKITDLPAQRFGIRHRGRLAPGYFADITIFDQSSVNSTASYEHPTQAPVGIRHVFRNGKQIFNAETARTQ